MTHLILHYVAPGLWGIFYLFWFLASSRVKATARAEGRLWTAATRALIVLGYGVIFFGHGLYLGPWNARFVPLAPAWVVGGCLIQVIGMGFAIAARHFLGSNWSSRVTIKVDHRLITGGPYALARHPIYTGMLLGLAGTVIAYGTVVGLVGFLLVAIAYWHKMATEERFLREQFGSDYEDYRRRVKALVPFVL